MRFSNIILASFGAVAVCAAPSSRHVLHEKRAEAPKYWERTTRLHPGAILPMRIGLTQSNLHKGDELLMEM